MPITLARLASELLTDPSLAPLTKRSYECALSPFVEAHGRTFVENITRHDIEAHFGGCTHLRSSTVNPHQTIIKRLFALGVECGHIQQSPASFLKRQKPLAERGECATDEPVRYLRSEEVRLLYGAASRTPRLFALISLLQESGARISEVLALDLVDIDWEQREFRVVGKGNKKRWCFFGEGAKSALRKYLHGHREHPHEALFTERHAFRRDVRRLRYDTAYRELGAALADAPTLDGLGFHHLRHTFATDRAHEVPLEVLRALMGHENIQTTLIYQKVTSHIAREAAHKALERLSRER